MSLLVPNPLLDDLCMFAVYMVAIYNYYCMDRDKKGTNYVFFVLFILLFSLLYRPIGGDFWHYLLFYEDGTHGHMEDFYYWLMEVIPNNYILWRIAIWLPAAIFLAIVFKMMKVPSSYATSFFLILALQTSFYYTRNTLALSILYLAVSVFCIRGKYAKMTIKIVIFGGLVYASWFLHKSMTMHIGLASIALLLPFNKKYIFIALLVFPFLYDAINSISSSFINYTEIWLNEDAAEYYLEASNELSLNWKGVVSMAIRYAPVVYFYYIAFLHPIPSYYKDFSFYKPFLMLSFFTFYLSLLFFFHSSDTLQGRIYKSSMIPFVFVVSIYFKHNMGSKRCNTFVFLLLINYAWNLFVSATTALG